MLIDFKKMILIAGFSILTLISIISSIQNVHAALPGLNLKALGGASFAINSGNSASNYFGASLVYDSPSNLELGGEFNTLGSTSQLSFILNVLFNNGFYLGLRPGVNLVSPAPAFIAPQIGYELTLHPGIEIGPELQYLYWFSGATSSVQTLLFLKFRL